MAHVVKVESLANWGFKADSWIEENTNYYVFESLSEALNKLNEEITSAKRFERISYRVSLRIDNHWSTPYESDNWEENLAERYEILSNGLE